MTRVVLWRHSPTNDNHDGRLQGRRDTLLTPASRSLASAAAREIVEFYGTSLNILSSPLARALGSAEVLGEVAGCAVGVDERLTQRSYGVWEGLTLDEVRKAFPEQLARRDAGFDPDIPGWESAADLSVRFTAVMADLLRDAGNAGLVPGTEPTVTVLVGHGSSLGIGLRGLLGLPLQGSALGPLSHANWSEVALTASGWSLIRHNAGTNGWVRVED